MGVTIIQVSNMSVIVNIQVIRVSAIEGWPDYSGQECMEGWLRYRGVA